MIKIKLKEDEALAYDSQRSGRFVDIEPEEVEDLEECENQ